MKLPATSGSASGRSVHGHVLLDLDGTLTDPFVGISTGILHAFETIGVAAPDRATLRRMIGPPFQETFPALGVPTHLMDDAIEAYRNRYDHGGGLFDATVYDGVIPALEALVDAGCELALATSKPTEPAERIVAHFGIAEHLRFVGGATPDGTRRHKADVIAHVLAALDPNPSRTVMVGDREVDILGGRHHGLATVGVRWGYADPGELEQHAPDALVEHPTELATTVLRLINRVG